jgi:hypothetical protein
MSAVDNRYRLTIEQLETRILLSSFFWIGGNTQGTPGWWNITENWQVGNGPGNPQNLLPGSSDDVFFQGSKIKGKCNGGGTVGSLQIEDVGKFSFLGTIVVTGKGTQKVSKMDSGSVGGNLTFQSGTTFQWTGGKVYAANVIPGRPTDIPDGGIEIDNGAKILIAPTNNVALDRRAKLLVTTGAEADWTSGEIFLSNGAVIRNDGSFYVKQKADRVTSTIQYPGVIVNFNLFDVNTSGT